jgi:3-oxoacyl-[acyl-carrier-protein] synthase-3
MNDVHLNMLIIKVYLMRNIKIVGTGIYIPTRCITSQELAVKMQVDEEIIQKMGMTTRYYANSTETASYMGAQAAKNALKDAKLTLDDIDLLICASGTMEMPIPCTAALIHKELKPAQPFSAFDINSTCLSFLTAVDTISYLMAANRYRHVLIVSSEIASVGLNYNDLESAALFGDGAAAVVVSQTASNDSSCIIASQMNTYSAGWHHCMIYGGGTGYPPKNWVPGHNEMFQFHMNGKEVFKLALQVLPDFVDQLFAAGNTKMEEIDIVIPHQASLSAMNILQKKLNIESKQMINIVEDFGNMIAASIPMALHHAIKTHKLCRGHRVLLLGTSAGISVGGMILDY